MTLGLSTEHRSVPEWELVLAKPQDLSWYDCSEALKEAKTACRCFQEINLDPDQGQKKLHLKPSTDFLQLLLQLPVTLLTTAQWTPQWFMLRRNSLTSSTTDKAIACCNGTKPWILHDDSCALITMTQAESKQGWLCLALRPT